MPGAVSPSGTFRYDHYELDPAAGRLVCVYRLGSERFREEITLAASSVPEPEHPEGGPNGQGAPGDESARRGAALEAAARLVFLLAGVSYYKVASPRRIDLGPLPCSDLERQFLKDFYVEGLAELSYRNHLDIADLEITGSGELETGPPSSPDTRVLAEPARGGKPLVPFGGGIDSIVVAEAVRERHPDAALFVVSPAGGRIDAIEVPAAVTGLPVLRAERAIDPQLLRSSELGYLNGHVPVTGILSAISVMAAVWHGRDTVVMSNEWSASAPTLVATGRPVNHQWSKSIEFERRFRQVLAAAHSSVEYFSLLRPFSELWVARRFAELTRYRGAFRSCNRAFRLDPARRLAQWCGECDKCCFIDLILSPYLEAPALAAVFDDTEPLARPELLPRFRALVGLGEQKPFECVGDVGECRIAARLAVRRPDRRANEVLETLVAEIDRIEACGDLDGEAERWLAPLGESYIPDAYTPEDQLV